MPLSALTIQPYAFARTTYAAIPGVRPIGSLAAPWVAAIGVIRLAAIRVVHQRIDATLYLYLVKGEVLKDGL